jgi:hypothetical protein
MAFHQYKVDINLNGNRIITGGFEELAAAPASPGQGQMYFNTANKKLWYFDGTVWVDPASVSDAITHISGSIPSVVIDDTDKTNVTVTVNEATGTTSGLMPSGDKAILDAATDAATNDAIAKRSATGTIKGATPVDPTDLTTKAYVDALISSGMRIKGLQDCADNLDYPAAIVGDAYHVSGAGKIGGATGEDVSIGDMIICVVDTAAGDHATVGSSWIILETNNNPATDVLVGNVRFANATEVTAGTATDVAITPADVVPIVGGPATPYTETLATGSTSYTVTHNLNGLVNVQVTNTATGTPVVVGVAQPTLNTVTITVNVALANQLTVACLYCGPAL